MRQQHAWCLQIKNYARVADSIVGWGSRLGTWSRLENHSVIGEDVFVRDEVLLNGAIVLPHKVRSPRMARVMQTRSA
jgi:NDP-sugar pyrophosphorylase family protein